MIWQTDGRSVTTNLALFETLLRSGAIANSPKTEYRNYADTEINGRARAPR